MKPVRLMQGVKSMPNTHGCTDPDADNWLHMSYVAWSLCISFFPDLFWRTILTEIKKECNRRDIVLKSKLLFFSKSAAVTWELIWIPAIFTKTISCLIAIFAKIQKRILIKWRYSVHLVITTIACPGQDCKITDKLVFFQAIFWSYLQVTNIYFDKISDKYIFWQNKWQIIYSIIYDCPALAKASLCQLRFPPRSSNRFASNLESISISINLEISISSSKQDEIFHLAIWCCSSSSNSSILWFSKNSRRFSLFSSQPTSVNDIVIQNV